MQLTNLFQIEIITLKTKVKAVIRHQTPENTSPIVSSVGHATSRSTGFNPGCHPKVNKFEFLNSYFVEYAVLFLKELRSGKIQVEITPGMIPKMPQTHLM